MMLLFLISLVIINNLHLSPLLVTCSSSSSFRCHQYESSALLSFKNSLSSIQKFRWSSAPYAFYSLADWKNGTDCCDWHSITCDPTSHHVVQLSVSGSGIVGTIDSNSSLFQLRHLRDLDMSYNDFSHSPISPMFGSSFPYLESLDLHYSNFSGEIPLQISYLSKLNYLDFTAESNGLVNMKTSTFGNIISNMTRLEYLYLTKVNISSTLPPSLTNLSSIQYLELIDCKLRGELSANVLNLPQLQFISLGGNDGLYAKFPISNWSTSLTWIDLSSVNFSSKLPTSNIQSSQANPLDGLLISGCSFYGQIPDWVWNITTSSFGIWDLSNNEFTGNINLKGNVTGNHIYISHNYLTGNLMSLSLKQFDVVDVSYNMFDGSLPIVPIGHVHWFSASNNNFTGPLYSSLCNLTSLLILDLSNNSLNGELPQCLGNMRNLKVLNLGSNNIFATLSHAIFSNCSSLEYLDLSVNWLKGLVPWSLGHCKSLRVLNLRNNKFRDRFPHWLANLSDIQLVDLSYNDFFGSLTPSKSATPFPRLQILNLSNNNFSGKIPTCYVDSFKAMMNNTQSVIGSPMYMQSDSINDIVTKDAFDGIYFYSTTFVFNGVTLKYDKIITTLATFDLSNNKFEEKIPENIGKLISIHGLNLSHNQLSGSIPSSLGNLTFLNSLDLSCNKLTGKIPHELTSLASLGFFNVSENQLEGPIPHENHFDTFSAESYIGNPALCGFPLPKCKEHGMPRPQPPNENPNDDKEIMTKWKVVMMSCGFGTFVSFVWGCYMLSMGRPLWLLKILLFLVDLVEKRLFGRRRRARRVRN